MGSTPSSQSDKTQRLTLSLQSSQENKTRALNKDLFNIEQMSVKL